jgi:hypothetical protein
MAFHDGGTVQIGHEGRISPSTMKRRAIRFAAILRQSRLAPVSNGEYQALSLTAVIAARNLAVGRLGAGAGGKLGGAALLAEGRRRQ